MAIFDINNMTVCRATSQDIERLNDLYVLLTGKKSDISDMRRVFPFYEANDDYCLLVAKTGNYVIGTGMAIIFRSLSNDCRPYLVIDNVAVDVAYQHKGVGTMLFNEFHKFGSKHNCCMAYLVAEVDNINAHKFYEKMGYVDSVVGFQKTF